MGMPPPRYKGPLAVWFHDFGRASPTAPAFPHPGTGSHPAVGWNGVERFPADVPSPAYRRREKGPAARPFAGPAARLG